MAHDIQANPLPLPQSPVAPLKISYQEFLDTYDGTWAEWVDGEVIPLSPPSIQHQLLVSFLSALLQFFVEAKRLGIVLPAPCQMRAGDQLPGREPDILFIAEEHRDRLRRNHIAGPADLAVEIISPDSLVRDRGEKFYEYEQGGVREYWLLDPLRRLAEFYELDGGVYRLAPVENGVYRSAVLPGLWMQVEWLWQEPLPSLMNILKEWGLVAK